MPLIRFFVFVYITMTCFGIHAWRYPWQSARQWCIVIDPAGDSQKPGRTITDTYERSLTFAWAEQLKKMIEQEISSVTVLLARLPTQVMTPFTTAHLAHRYNADLVISLACYHEQQPKPQLWVYHFSYGQEFITAFDPLHMYTLDTAYLASAPTTQKIAQSIMQELQKNDYQSYFETRGIFKLPLVALLGIKTPALLLELGAKQGMVWQPILHAITLGIKSWIESQ